MISVRSFENLVAVAISDNLVDEKELEFLAEKAIDLGLPENRINEIIENQNNLIFSIPETAEEKEEELSNIVYLSLVDGVLDEKEYNMCLAIAYKMELAQKDLDSIIELTKKLWFLEQTNH